MNKYIIIAAIALVVAAIATICVQRSRIIQLTEDRDKYKTNTETLLQEFTQYQTEDSLNAAKVGILELKLSEFEKYRASDAELIQTMQTKNRELQSVTTAQMETITQLQGTVRDSILYIRGDTTVLRWRKGQINPTIDKLILLCDYFGVSSDYLIGLED